jgi:hypothetical protein
MLQYFVTSKGLEDVLFILSIAFMPSVLGLICAFYALGLPDESNGSNRTLPDRAKLRTSR